MKLRRYKLSSNRKRNLRSQSTTSLNESAPSSDDEDSNNYETGHQHSDNNVVDPIMLGPLEKNIFKFIRPNGTTVLFNIESLIDYLISSGDFTDPETRIPFTDEHLKEIDQMVFICTMFIYIYSCLLDL